MGWLFGRHRKSQAEKTLEELQQQAEAGTSAPDFTTPAPVEPVPPVGHEPDAAQFDAGGPTPAQPEATDFSMRIDNRFSITGRGLVITGTVDSGSVRSGQQVRVISRVHGTSQPYKVLGIESFRKMRDSAQAGDAIGLLVRGLSRGDVDAGDQIVG